MRNERRPQPVEIIGVRDLHVVPVDELGGVAEELLLITAAIETDPDRPDVAPHADRDVDADDVTARRPPRVGIWLDSEAPPDEVAVEALREPPDVDDRGVSNIALVEPRAGPPELDAPEHDAHRPRDPEAWRAAAVDCLQTHLVAGEAVEHSVVLNAARAGEDEEPLRLEERPERGVLEHPHDRPAPPAAVRLPVENDADARRPRADQLVDNLRSVCERRVLGEVEEAGLLVTAIRKDARQVVLGRDQLNLHAPARGVSAVEPAVAANRRFCRMRHQVGESTRGVHARQSRRREPTPATATWENRRVAVDGSDDAWWRREERDRQRAELRAYAATDEGRARLREWLGDAASPDAEILVALRAVRLLRAPVVGFDPARWLEKAVPDHLEVVAERASSLRRFREHVAQPQTTKVIAATLFRRAPDLLDVSADLRERAVDEVRLYVLEIGASWIADPSARIGAAPPVPIMTTALEHAVSRVLRGWLPREREVAKALGGPPARDEDDEVADLLEQVADEASPIDEFETDDLYRAMRISLQARLERAGDHMCRLVAAALHVLARTHGAATRPRWLVPEAPTSRGRNLLRDAGMVADPARLSRPPDEPADDGALRVRQHAFRGNLRPFLEEVRPRGDDG